MPVIPHPLIPSPRPDLQLKRYLNFTKFVFLLTKRALWFARADKLGDPFEASVPNWVPALLHETETNTLYRMSQHDIEFQAKMNENLRLHLFVNCWYSGQNESAAMWSIYGSPRDGVAIRTTVERLSSALGTDPHNITVGAVQYFDYSSTEFPPAASPDWVRNALIPAFSKRLSYEHEIEVRAVLTHFPDPGTEQPAGLTVDADLDTLVTEVTVAPFAEQWFVELVQTCTKNAGLAIPVLRSDIGGSPNWGPSVPPGLAQLPEFPPLGPSR